MSDRYLTIWNDFSYTEHAVREKGISGNNLNKGVVYGWTCLDVVGLGLSHNPYNTILGDSTSTPNL